MNDLDTVPVIKNRLAVTRRVARISLHRFARERSGIADILIIPDLKGMPYISDKYNQPMYDAGIKAARLMMPEIRKILAQKGIR